jgi:hypothetical protein
LVIGSSASRSVWLVVDPNSDQTLSSGVGVGCRIEEVSVSGVVKVKPKAFPCGWTIEGPAPGGVLVGRNGSSKNGGALVIWNPSSDRTSSPFGPRNLNIDSESSSYVIWQGPGCGSHGCPYEATNLKSHRTRPLPGLPKGWFANSSYIVAPNGPFVAVEAVSSATEKAIRSGDEISPPCCYYGVRPVKGLLAVYNLRSDSVVEFRPLTLAVAGRMYWAPDETHLFLTRDLTQIEAVGAWSSRAPVRVVTVRPAVSSQDLYQFTGSGIFNVAESFLPVAR